MTSNEIGTNKVLIWKTDLNYLDVGKIDKDKNIFQILFTGIKSVDDFNQEILNSIKDYESQIYNPKMNTLFDIIRVEDITGFIISQVKWRRCSAYLVIQTSNLGYRYLCYFYDHIHHSAECFGTSYNLVKKTEIIKYFNERLDEVQSNLDFNRYPELRAPILNRDFENNFGIS